jgi:hypothetical protein
MPSTRSILHTALAASALLASVFVWAPTIPTSAATCQSWGAPPPKVGSEASEFLAVAAVSPCTVWAVGDYGDGPATKTLIQRWNGSSWQRQPSPNPSLTSSLRAIDAISLSDVWAAGNHVNGSASFTLVEHWNGHAWRVVPSPSPGSERNQLNGLWARSPADVWAVGSRQGADGVRRALIEHWNGHRWKVRRSPEASPGPNELFGVEGTSATDVWAVGRRNPNPNPVVLDPRDRPLIEHWNGRAWKIVPSPNPGGEHGYLLSVSAVTSGAAWAVGYGNIGSPLDGTARTLIERWNGRAWKIQASPKAGQGFDHLRGVAMRSPRDGWAVGDRWDGVTSRTLIERWDGHAWRVQPAPNPQPENVLFGVAILSPLDVWAVGESRDVLPETLALKCC